MGVLGETVLGDELTPSSEVISGFITFLYDSIYRELKLSFGLSEASISGSPGNTLTSSCHPKVIGAAAATLSAIARAKERF